MLTDPVTLDNAGHLWITRKGGEVAADAIRRARAERRETTHVVADRVAYCHWAPDGSGAYGPTLIVEAGEVDSGYAWVTPTGRYPLPDLGASDFSRAFSWGDRVVVPTRGGCAVLTVSAGGGDGVDLAGR